MPADDLYKPTNPSFQLGKKAVNIAQNVSVGTLEGVRSILAKSFEWTSVRLAEISGAPLIENSELASFLKKTGNSLQQAAEKTEEGLTRALESTAMAMQKALESLDGADSVVKKTLFENIPISSIVGDSFADFLTTSLIRPSFRLNGSDVGANEVVQDWKKSGLQNVIVCVPGLFCDEGLWNAKGEVTPSAIMVREGYYPIYVRFNPGAHISENGVALLTLLEELLSSPEFAERKLDFISFSQGGLIFRSALFLARQKGFPLSNRIRHALLISSPDGGSYIEKIGFWLGLGAESLPVFPVNLIGFIGNQRSDAMKDLSHGIIREEDWKNPNQISRYKQELYFNELDDVNATQVYSLVTEEEGNWSDWIGDGIVEKPSLVYLSERVYRKKPNPETRVWKLTGLSHYQIMTSSALKEILIRVLK
ncbi:hypothetical protein LEP1GSC058_3799 [Leptospira fainei serovar Hurstbridge str. BUT 6]|uniref:PF05057 family protein n=1 Tax=Leptospira fainei serovar Hurstbridge str. BUT 6 TaxID=1193011 RepID=S3UYX1_9LEPT|nr:hypothetical protein [Leptospira fainei]EPG74428.1 hypothetical protein LEP1GSC058_3799 [Leptospira fainei serovar Hurstbridge str. BUT 6]